MAVPVLSHHADGTEFVGTGIHPDIVVNPTIADVRLGIDTVLKAATEHLKQQ